MAESPFYWKREKRMPGLKRGTVRLEPHRAAWEADARETIAALKLILGETAIDIQHVGSTAIPAVHAKPIIDLAVGVRELRSLTPHLETLRENGFVYRGEDVRGEALLVRGDFEADTRTHHIHVVEWNGAQWRNYLNFRDYLNAFPEKAQVYDDCKQCLAARFPNDRKRYTAGKESLIAELLKEAEAWRAN